MNYSEKILDYFENPKNTGSFKPKSNIGTGIVGTPSSGTVIQLQIRVNKKNLIQDACFKTYGCGSAIAASSLMTEKIKGKTLEEALEIKNGIIVTELDLPPAKMHCAILAEDAVKAAIHDYRQRQGKTEKS